MIHLPIHPRLIAAISLLVCISSASGGHENPAKPGEEVIADQYLVHMVRGVTGTAFMSALSTDLADYPLGNNLHLVVTHDPNVVANLKNHPLVDFVEPNRVRGVNLQSPNDPSFASLWGAQTLQALQAWQLMPAQYPTASFPESGRVKVAVLDTGADCTHPDFMNAGRASTDAAQGGQFSWALSRAYYATAVTAPACPWQDDYGHGTHVAGTIAAAANNGVGVAGIAFPVELVVYKVLASNGTGDDGTIASAIMDAVNAGARIISMSLGGSGYSQSLQLAINYAWEHDVVVAAAAGNSNSNAVFYPGDANFAVTVAATDSSNNRASFSNWGSAISLAAPGVGIYSTAPTYPVTMAIQNYATMSGTSMATPHVSAVAGLIETAYPNAPAAAVIERLQQSAQSLTANGGWDQNIGYGVVNAYDAVSGSLRVSTLGGITGQVRDGSDFPVANAQVSAGGSTVTTDTSGLFRFANLSPGTYTVQASAASFPTQTLTATVVAGADAHLPIIMPGTYGQFSGTVTAAGSPAAGAVVQALSGGLIKATAFTNTNGQYSLWVPAAGAYDIRVGGIGWATNTVTSQSVAAGGNTQVNLTASKLGSIAGVVMDASGNPVANAQLTASAASYTAGAASDNNGNYSTMALPVGMYTVKASAAGMPDATVSGVVVGSGVVTVNLRMGAAPVSVSVAPGAANLTPGQAQQFTATVTNASDASVTWSLSPNVGSIASSGMYQAPAIVSQATTVTLTATSNADRTKSASATVTITPPPVSITVTPTAATVQASQGVLLAATVANAADTSVMWSLSPSVGTISGAGFYQAPAAVAQNTTVIVTATSNADPTKSAAASITVTPAITVTVSPANSTLQASQTQQFYATLANTANPMVTWTMSPQLGTLSGSGLYTAPASIAWAQAVTITATSYADPTKSASVTVNLSPPPQVNVSVAPLAPMLAASQSQQFTATVTGSSNTAVTWSISPLRGTITASGLYTAPADASNELVTLTCRSAANPNVQASTVIFLKPAAGLTISPVVVTLSPTQSAQFSVSSGTAVNWTFTPSLGTLINGVYTAPASITSAQTITITATSQTDPTKSAVATVNLVVPPPVAVTLSPAAVTLTSGQSQAFTPVITGSSNTAVSWTINPPNAGSVVNGVYTAPMPVTAAQTVVITATSQADATKAASAVVNLIPPRSMSIVRGADGCFSALVQGLNNGSTMWTLSPQVGQLTIVFVGQTPQTNGVLPSSVKACYTPPGTTAAASAVTLSAISIVDPSLSASITVDTTTGALR